MQKNKELVEKRAREEKQRTYEQMKLQAYEELAAKLDPQESDQPSSGSQGNATKVSSITAK